MSLCKQKVPAGSLNCKYCEKAFGDDPLYFSYVLPVKNKNIVTGYHDKVIMVPLTEDEYKSNGKYYDGLGVVLCCSKCYGSKFEAPYKEWKNSYRMFIAARSTVVKAESSQPSKQAKSNADKFKRKFGRKDVDLSGLATD